jgi:hypothetical protein
MRCFAAILILLAVALSGYDASAQPFPRGNGGQQMQSLNSILGNIRREYPGQLSDVQGPTNGRYLIKWLTPEGQVLLLDVDARTGRVIGVRGDDNFRRQNFAPAPAFLPQRRRSRSEGLERGPADRPVERFGNRTDRWNR